MTGEKIHSSQWKKTIRPGQIEINPNINHVAKDCVRNQVTESGGMVDNSTPE